MKSIVLLFLGIFLLQIGFSQWNQQVSNTTYDLNDVFFTSNNIGMAVGNNGRITKTVDGGTNWTSSNAIPTCNLNSVFFSSIDSGWIASSCGIYSTTDGGLNWSLQTSGNGEEVNDIFFYNSQFGWAVGNKLSIMRTVDGGANWTIDTLASYATNNPLLAVYFRDSNNGWIGGGEKLHYTTDGGLSWTQGSSLLIDWIYSIDFGDDYNGVGAGMGGSTTYTYDWGTNWAFNGSATPNNEYIYGVSFSSADSVYMVGQSGIILFSNNGGSNWATQTSGVTNNLNGVYFPSLNTGYAVGDAGTILKCANNCTPTYSTDSQVACNSYTWIDGVTYTSSNNTATHTLVNAEGCDSIITLNLTINTINTSITQTGLVLTAGEVGVNYQWLDCSAMSIITGSTSQSYTATENGEYAVIVSNNICLDTSSCFAVTNVGIVENSFGSDFIVFPNPTKGNISIDLGARYQSISTKITDLSGKIIQSNTYNESQLLNLNLEESTGVYVLIIESGDKIAVIRLIKE